MNELLADILDAHGGLGRWNEYERVEVTLVSGGGLFPLKGASRGDRSLARRCGDVARVARLFSRLDGDTQPRSGFFLRRGSFATPPRLLREHRGRFLRNAIDLRLCDSERCSFADQASGLHTRTGSPANPGNADGLNRFEPDPARVAKPNQLSPNISEDFRT